MDRLFYFIADSNQKVLQVGDCIYPALAVDRFSSIKEVITGQSDFKGAYKSVKIGVLNSYVSLIPERFLSPESIRTYLEKSMDTPPGLVCISQSIKNTDANIVYGIEEALIIYLKQFFSNPKIFHASYSFIQGLLASSTSDTGAQVFINVNGNTLQMVVLDGKNLQYYNSFEFKTSEDFIYYVLLVYDQLALPRERHLLHISGGITEASKIYTLLHRYIRNIRFITRPGFLHFDKNVKAIPSHYLFDLFSLKVCE